MKSLLAFPDGTPVCLIVMGVSASGKSTIGAALAKALSLPFIEGDALHSAKSITKMSSGVPLTDEDRWPWLDRIAASLREAEGGAIASCSALKKTYRQRLRNEAGGPVVFLFLDGSASSLAQRMLDRKGHFMKLSMLDSQLATLERPVFEPLVLTLDIDQPVADIVAQATGWLNILRRYGVKTPADCHALTMQ